MALIEARPEGCNDAAGVAAYHHHRALHGEADAQGQSRTRVPPGTVAVVQLHATLTAERRENRAWQAQADLQHGIVGFGRRETLGGALVAALSSALDAWERSERTAAADLDDAEQRDACARGGRHA